MSTTTPPVSAPFVIVNPVTVDPDDPATKPPLIVGVAVACPDQAAVSVLVENIDPFHYPDPFPAIYEWTLSDGGGTVAGGVLQLAGLQTGVAFADTVPPGTYTFTVTDVDLGLSASTEVVAPDCAGLPAPEPGPLPPVALVPSITCDDIDLNPALGDGWIILAVLNEGNDGGGERAYTYSIVSADTQMEVDSGNLTAVDQSAWGVRKITGLLTGSYVIEVVDADDPTLSLITSVDVPPCPPDPQPTFPEHSTDFIFLGASTTCASISTTDGSASVHVLDQIPPSQNGWNDYEWILELAGGAIASGAGGWVQPGAHVLYLFDLAAGDYELTLTVHDPWTPSTPSTTHAYSFSVADCPVGPPVTTPDLNVWGVSTHCFGGDPAEALLYFVDHGWQPSPIHWAVHDADMAELVGGGPTFLDGATDILRVVRHLPPGTGYTLEVRSTGGSQPTVVSQPFDVGSCADPVDPTDTSPVDPVATSEPDSPADTPADTPADSAAGDPVDITTAEATDPPASNDPGTSDTGTSDAAVTPAMPAGGGPIPVLGPMAQHAP